MSNDAQKGPSSSKTTPVAATGGGKPSDDSEPRPPQTRADKSIPIGTPLTEEELRRLKEKAERPETVPTAPVSNDRDSAPD